MSKFKLFGPPKAVLGIDVGFHSIKIVELKSTGKGYQVTASAIARKPEGETEEALGSIIGGMLKDAKIHTRHAITSISRAMDERVIIKPITMPSITADISKEELREAVKFEAVHQEYIPYEVEGAMIDCHVLGEKSVEGEKGLEILLVAAPLEILENRAISLIAAGLIPIAIDIDFFALIRLLVYTGAVTKDQNTAIIDMGSSQTSIGFLQQGRFHIYPEIQMGSNEIDSEIARSKQISKEEAEQLKYKQELFTSEDQQNWRASDDIRDALESRQGLLTQIQNRFFAYESEMPDSKLSKVIFTGGGSQVINFDKYLQSQLQIPIERTSYSDKILMQSKKEMPIQTNEATFTTAVGLSLKGRV